MNIPESTEFTEVQVGPTPLGGVYSVAYYRDKFHRPCRKEDACYIEISIFDENDRRINGVHGTCGEEKNHQFTDEEREYYAKIKLAYDAVDMGMSPRIAIKKFGLPRMSEWELRDEFWAGRNARLI